MRRVAALLAAGVVLAGCGANESKHTAPDPSETPALAPTPSPSAPHRTGATVIAARSRYGPLLHDASGQAIYLFDREKGSTPDCYADCARAWPPVLTDGAPVPGTGIRPGLLGTTKRKDGRTQVTYAGHPLYFYAHEGKYQVLCHDVREYGGTWLAVRPDGTPAPA